MNPIVRNEIKAVLNGLREKDYYAEDIPFRIASNVRSAFRLPLDEELFALLDLSLFRKGRSGLLFTNKGIYWKYTIDFASYTWEQFAEIRSIKAIDPTRLQLDEHQTIDINKVPTPEQIAMMLRELRDIVRRHALPAPMPEETLKEAAAGLAAASYESTAYEGLSRDEVIRKVVSSMGTGSFLAPFEGKLKSRLEERFLIPNEDQALAFLDFRTSAPGKEGIMLASRGIYWRSKIRTRCYTWEDLYAAPWITLPEKSELAIDGQKMSYLSTTDGLKNTGIRKILEKLISLRPMDADYVAAVLPPRYWSALKEEETLPAYDRHVVRSIASKRTANLKFSLVPPEQASLEHGEVLVSSTADSFDRFARGVTVSNKGIYMRDSVFSGSAREASFIPYGRLAHAELQLEANKRLFVNSWLVNESSMATDIYNLLADFQAYALSLLAENAPETYGEEALYMDIWPIPVTGSIKAKRWVVAEDKVIRGVWDEFELRHGLENGLIPPGNLDFWTEGSKQWAPLEETELASSVAGM